MTTEPLKAECPECEGTGVLLGGRYTDDEVCPDCHDIGQAPVEAQEAKNRTKCPRCGGVNELPNIYCGNPAHPPYDLQPEATVTSISGKPLADRNNTGSTTVTSSEATDTELKQILDGFDARQPYARALTLDRLRAWRDQQVAARVAEAQIEGINRLIREVQFIASPKVHAWSRDTRGTYKDRAVSVLASCKNELARLEAITNKKEAEGQK